jgi:hypothetical protein
MIPTVDPLVLAAAALSGGALSSLVLAGARFLGGRARPAVSGARRLTKSSRPLPWLARRSGLAQDALRSMRQDLPGVPAIPAGTFGRQPLVGPRPGALLARERVAASGFRAALSNALEGGTVLAERTR